MGSEPLDAKISVTNIPKMKVGSFQLIGTGAVSVGGIGFMPTALLIWTTVQGAASGEIITSFGWRTANVSGCQYIECTASSASRSGTSAAEVIHARYGVQQTLATFSAFGADGFTLNVSDNTIAPTCCYVAIG